MPESARSRSRPGRATAASCWRTGRSRRSSSTWKRCRRCRGTHAAPTAWAARCSTARPPCPRRRSVTSRRARRSRSTWPRTSRTSCSTIPSCPPTCAARSTPGSRPSARTSGRRATPSSSSSTRPASRRSGRSNGGCGISGPPSATPWRPTWRRRSPFCSSNCASPTRVPSWTASCGRRCNPTPSRAPSRWPPRTIWRRGSERARRRARVLPARSRDRGGGGLPVRSRGRGDPRQAGGPAARAARAGEREGGRARATARQRRHGGRPLPHRPRSARAPSHRGEAQPSRRQGAPPRRGGGRAGRVRAEAGWHRSVTGVVRRTLEAAYEDNIPFLASALSFDLLLTVIPFVAMLLDLAMVLGTGALLVLSGLVAAWEAGNAALMSTSSFALDWLWRFGLETAAFAAGVLLFFGVFKLLPSRRIHWRTALVAAVFCSLGFEVAKRLYALYVIRFATLDRLASDANVVALALFLLWVYYTAYIFLLGGEVAETYDLMRMRRSQRVQLG